MAGMSDKWFLLFPLWTSLNIPIYLSAGNSLQTHSGNMNSVYHQPSARKFKFHKNSKESTCLVPSFQSVSRIPLIYGLRNFANTIGLFCWGSLSWLRFFTSCSTNPLFYYTGPDEVKHNSDKHFNEAWKPFISIFNSKSCLKYSFKILFC